MVAAWLKSFDKEMTVVAVGEIGASILDGEAVKVMKEVKVTLDKECIGTFGHCKTKNWDYVVIINQCIKPYDEQFTGNVLHWESLQLKDYVQATDDNETIYDYYIRVRDRVRYQLMNFYLTILGGKEMIGADSCGAECDIL